MAWASFVEGFQKSRDDRAFDLYGRHATTRPAENVVQDMRQGVGKAQGVSGVYWYADFTFKTEEGQEVTLTHLPLAPSQVDPVVGGRPMDIVYLPGHPTTVRWPGWEPQSSQTTWGSLLLFLAASAGFWFLRKTAR